MQMMSHVMTASSTRVAVAWLRPPWQSHSHAFKACSRHRLQPIRSAGSANSGGGVQAEPDLQAMRVEAARSAQQRCTDLLARLLEASDPVGLARQNAERLDESFFMAASAYLTLARKEGNTDVAGRLEQVLSAAWAVKQSTLRPELQLLNTLVRAETEAARRQVYTAGGADLLATLSMNDRWFASMLARMTSDVERQPPNPGKASLLQRLRAIKKETEALERQAARQKQA